MIQTEFLARVASTHPPTLYSQLYNLDKYILKFRQIQFAIRTNTFCASAQHKHHPSTLYSQHCTVSSPMHWPDRKEERLREGWVGAVQLIGECTTKVATVQSAFCSCRPVRQCIGSLAVQLQQQPNDVRGRGEAFSSQGALLVPVLFGTSWYFLVLIGSYRYFEVPDVEPNDVSEKFPLSEGILCGSALSCQTTIVVY